AMVSAACSPPPAQSSCRTRYRSQPDVFLGAEPNQDQRPSVVSHSRYVTLMLITWLRAPSGRLHCLRRLRAVAVWPRSRKRADQGLNTPDSGECWLILGGIIRGAWSRIDRAVILPQRWRSTCALLRGDRRFKEVRDGATIVPRDADLREPFPNED